jgi:hypothetical protein
VGAVLVIQGDADATVDWRYNVGFVSALFPAAAWSTCREPGINWRMNRSLIDVRIWRWLSPGLGNVVSRWMTLKTHGIDLRASSGARPKAAL